MEDEMLVELTQLMQVSTKEDMKLSIRPMTLLSKRRIS